ncbi:hypothetical protein [Rubrivirga sp.]|uniref:hypothetical protein n=1 Tax=Rubrivirga sp. TaxID=1885344 RepID=UPI003C774619
MRSSILLLSVLVVALIAGCDSSESALSREEREAFEDEIQAAILALEAAIGDARADDVSACRLAAISTDGCGNPSSFRVYSVTDGDTLEIQRLAARADSLNSAYNLALGTEPPCVTTEPPPLVLEEGRCRFEPQIVVN